MWIEPDEEITVSSRGAGFGDPVHSAIVEEAAMQEVLDFYEGWDAEDVSAQKCGWDVTFTRKKAGEVALVEVKGVSVDRPVVLLTRNEIRAAQVEANWHLAVVTRALRKPKVVEYTAAEAVATAQPHVYRAALPDESS